MYTHKAKLQDPPPLRGRSNARLRLDHATAVEVDSERRQCQTRWSHVMLATISPSQLHAPGPERWSNDGLLACSRDTLWWPANNWVGKDREFESDVDRRRFHQARHSEPDSDWRPVPLRKRKAARASRRLPHSAKPRPPRPPTRSARSRRGGTHSGQIPSPASSRSRYVRLTNVPAIGDLLPCSIPPRSREGKSGRTDQKPPAKGGDRSCAPAELGHATSPQH